VICSTGSGWLRRPARGGELGRVDERDSVEFQVALRERLRRDVQLLACGVRVARHGGEVGMAQVVGDEAAVAGCLAKPCVGAAATSRTRSSAGRSPTASTTFAGTKATSTSASTTTRRPSRSTRSEAGGSTSALSGTRRPRSFRSPPTAAAPTATAPSCGGRAAKARRRYRAQDRRLPLPTGDFEVEQNRAPAPLVHHDELARQAPGLPRDDHQPDRHHHHHHHHQLRARGLPWLDEGTYPADIKVSAAELAAVNLHGDKFHPEWNYSVTPRGS
jgi:hypothetical protein